MIKVTRKEVDVLRAKAPDTHIAIVNRHHRNKGYYAEESQEAMAILRQLRGLPEPPDHPRHRKKRW